MAGRETYPVERGKTYYGRSQTVPSSFEGRTIILEGFEATFKHTDPSNPSRVLSNRTVKATLQRNQSGITVMAGLAVTEQAGYQGRRFDGYSRVTAVKIAGVVDDHLWTAGCREGDLCWIQTEGPCYARYAGSLTVTVGEFVHSMTAANSTGNTSGGTTDNDAGKFINWEGTTSTATETTDGSLVKMSLNGWGRALSAATANNTAATKLIDLQIKN